MSELKKGPEVTVGSTPSHETPRGSSEPPNDSEWLPGFWVRFPWLGLGALTIALVACIGEMIVLVTSNGRSVVHWPEKIAPNVILSALNNLANICFSIAIGESFDTLLSSNEC